MKVNPEFSDLVKRYRIKDGKKFALKDFDPADTAGLKDEFKHEAQHLLKQGVESLAEYQDKLYAQNRWAVLLIFQAMDAAGKDSTIKHVMSGLNPQGCQVYSFKAPSAEELDHDYLWRTSQKLPARGNIGIFNRSYYEEVLVVRVHKELLDAERTPPELVTKDIWNQRFRDINNLESYLTRNGTVVRKFFLYVSKHEQKKRFLERLREPEKNWKFSPFDVQERKCWKDYMNAYEDMIRHTSPEHAPWYVVPADNKWFTRMVVAAAVAETLQSLKVKYPEVPPDKRKALDAAKAELEKTK